MKRCPTCNKTFTDRNLSFCIDDGTPLIAVSDSAGDPTVLSTSAASGAGAAASSGAGKEPPPYQPPGNYLPPGSTPSSGKRKVWPWVLAIGFIVVLMLGALGVVSAILLPRMMRGQSNDNANVRRADSNANRGVPNSNSDSTVANENTDISESDETTPAPTNEDEVLAQLTDLENEWTVANLNADKKKLDRILADDYVGKTSDGKAQGKADYLKTIERDTSIQKWNFEDLKVSVAGNRATLTGIIRLQIKDQEAAFNFVDKFVWRDGRWQATGSEVERMKE